MEIKTAQGRISRHKAHGLTPDALADQAKADEMELVDIYRAYNAALNASNLLDYDDLLLRCGDLLREHPECVANVQAVLVDEFQDTNIIQYELMNLFAAKNQRITIVGDPDQSIYGFRSAEIQNLRRMQRRYPNTSTIFLESNYRSSASILNSAQEVIEQDTTRPDKKPQPTHSFGTLPVLRKLPTVNAEALWMVLEIKRCVAMTGGLVRMSDIVVLLRSASLSTRIETAFGRAGIPYKMVGGKKFYDRTEVKVLLNYLRVVGNTGHTDALLSIVNVPPRRVGDETIKQLTSGAEKAQVPLWTFLKDVIQGRRSTEKKLQKAAELGLCSLVKLIDGSRQKLQDCQDSSAPRMLLEYITENLSFQEYLIRTYPLDEDGRWANVKELMGQANESALSGEDVDKENDLPEIEGIEQTELHSGEEALSRFLANVALSTEAISQNEGKEGEKAPETVTISTIHAAKGLEWPVVFIPAVYNGSIPHSRAEVIDEERRLLYVAMTRAQALLYLSLPLRQPRIGEGEDASTTLTPFLPPKVTTTRFRPKGPSFQEKIVYSIADILRRPRPSPEDMYKALDTLPSTLDDKWTAEGEEKRDFDSQWDRGDDSTEGPYPKRLRADGNRSTTTTFMSASMYNMNNSSNFIAPTTMSSGFSSARDYATDSVFDQDTTSEKKGGSAKEAIPANKGKSVGIKDGLTQASISNFFGEPGTSQKKEPTPTTSLPPRQAPRNHTPSQNNRPSSNFVPPTLSSHRLQPRPLRPTRPILEPSEPNNYTWLATPSRPVMRQGRVRAQQSNGNTTAEIESRSGEMNQDSSTPASQNTQSRQSDQGIQSVTFHTTTMTRVRQQTSVPVRRTLGIRRSMNGWEERMKRDGGGQVR